MDRFTQLSWGIIEYKMFYYYSHEVDSSWHKVLHVPDWKYDAFEDEYVELCKTLGKENTVVHKVGNGMMEVDFTRPSCKLVLSKLSKPRNPKNYPLLYQH